MLRRLAVHVCIGTMLIACSPAVVTSLLPSASGPMVKVTTRGGECPEGACGSTLVIERDGRLRQSAPGEFILGQVPPETLVILDGMIRATDFAALRARPFTGECLVNFDGQETIYEFGAPSGVERIASCETVIDPDHPLFAATREALAAVARPGG
jgi:hypothetical protein